MTRRPAATLMEVLIAMFIMSIGMLALLALFPIGAISMAQALKDDRCAASASMAEQMAIANKLRHDAYVTTLLNALDTPLAALNQPMMGQPLYIDPYGTAATLTSAGPPPLGMSLGAGFGSTGITRTTARFVGLSAPSVDRWFSLPDDISFAANGTPELTGGVLLDRGRRYTWAYLLRRAQAGNDEAVNLSVVVYAGRATDIPEPEPVYAGSAQAPNGILISSIVDIRRGNWILDTSANPTTGLIHADFYRVTNVQDIGGITLLEVQPNLQPHAFTVPQMTVTIMNNVAEVFDKGTSWRP
jgi:competence protein ComGC